MASFYRERDTNTPLAKLFVNGLRKQKPKLTEIIDASDDFLNHMRSKNVLNTKTYDTVKSFMVNHDRVGYIVDYLSKRNIRDFHLFLNCLETTNQNHVVRHINDTIINPRKPLDKWTKEDQDRLERRISDNTREWLDEEGFKGVSEVKKLGQDELILRMQRAGLDDEEIICLVTLLQQMVELPTGFKKTKFDQGVQKYWPVIEHFVDTDRLLNKLKWSGYLSDEENATLRNAHNTEKMNELLRMVQRRDSLSHRLLFLQILADLNCGYIVQMITENSDDKHLDFTHGVEVNFKHIKKKTKNIPPLEKFLMLNQHLSDVDTKMQQALNNQQQDTTLDDTIVTCCFSRSLPIFLAVQSDESTKQPLKNGTKKVVGLLKALNVDLDNIETEVQSKQVVKQLQSKSSENASLLKGLSKSDAITKFRSTEVSSKGNLIGTKLMIQPQSQIHSMMSRESHLMVEVYGTLVGSGVSPKGIAVQMDPASECYRFVPFETKSPKNESKPINFKATIYLSKSRLQQLNGQVIRFYYVRPGKKEDVYVYEDCIRNIELKSSVAGAMPLFDGTLYRCTENVGIIDTIRTKVGSLMTSSGHGEYVFQAIDVHFPPSPDIENHESVCDFLKRVNSMWHRYKTDNNLEFRKRLWVWFSAEMSSLHYSGYLLVPKAVILIFAAHKYGLTLMNTDERHMTLVKSLKLTPESMNSAVEIFEEWRSSGETMKIVRTLVDYYWEHRDSFFPACLYCLPIIHILQGVTGDEEAGLLTSDRVLKDAWWGVPIPDSARKDIKANWNDIQTVLDNLVPVFEVDRLIWKAVARCFTPRDFLQYQLYMIVPLDVTLSYMWKQIKQNFGIGCHLQNVETTCEGLYEVILMDKHHRIWSNDSYKDFSLEILSDLMEIFNQRRKQIDAFYVQLPLASLWLHLTEMILNDENFSKERKFFRKLEAEDVITKWACDFSNFPVNGGFETEMKEKLKFISKVLDLQFWASYSQKYKSCVLDSFEHHIAQKRVDIVVFIRFYCEYDEEIGQSVNDTFFKVVLAKTKHEMLGGNVEVFLMLRKPGMISKLLHLLYNIIEDSWNVCKSKTETLKHVLQWGPFIEFIKFIKRQPIQNHIEKDAVEQYINAGLDAIQIVTDMLQEGSIDLYTLQLLKENQNLFLSVHQVMEDVGIPAMTQEIPAHVQRQGYMESLLTYRLGQLEILEEIKPVVADFVNFTADLQEMKWISALTNAIHEVTAAPQDSNLNVGQFLTDAQLDLNSKYDLYSAVFALTVEWAKMMETMLKWKKSKYFLLLWRNEKHSVLTEKPEQPEEFFTISWQPLEEKFTRHLNGLATGNMTRDEFEAIEACLVDWTEANIHEDLRLATDDEEKHEQILSKIRILRQSRQQRHTIDAIIDMKEMYNIKKTFPIETFGKVGGTTPLKEIDSSHVDMLKDLANVTSKEEETIKAFTQSRDFVEWIDTEIKVNSSELSNIVMEAATDKGSFEHKLASCLENTLSSYESLLFNSLSEETTYEECMEKLKKVWSWLESIPSIADDLLEVNLEEHLNWIKKVKEAGGATSITAKDWITKIDERGIVHVKVPKVTTNLTLDDIISLEFVIYDGDAEELTPKTFSWMKDLLNKLVLTGQKADHEDGTVNRFYQLMRGISALGMSVLKLVCGGCLLFSNWSATFYYGSPKENTVLIMFDMKDERSLSAKSNDAVKDVNEVTTYLESRWQEWSKYLDKQREKAQELNFFTVDELVVLQNHLASLDNDNMFLSADTSALLECVKIGLTKDELKEILEEASAQLKDRIDFGQDTKVDEDDEPKIKQQREDFINDIEEAGYSRVVALHALRNCPTYDISEGLFWCLQHATEVDEDIDMDEITPCTVDESHQKIFSDLNLDNGNLYDNLENVWDKAIKYVSRGQTDFLSLEHVGLILQILGEKCEPLKRPFPKSFTNGQPNLIMCDERSAIQTLFRIFMEGDGFEKRQPGVDEILYCSDRTSTEEMNLFWQRLLNDNKGKIHCLFRAEHLQPEIVADFEAKVDDAAFLGSDYRLVIICCSKSEDELNVVRALSKYKITYQPKPCKHTVNDYLRQHTKVPEEISVSAANVDPERSSVRLIRSEAAGDGKTHYIQKLQQQMRQEIEGSGTVLLSFQSANVSIDGALAKMFAEAENCETKPPRMYHIDIGHNVKDSDVLCEFLFNLLLLGSCRTKSGRIVKRAPQEYYIIEGVFKERNDIDGSKQETLLGSIVGCLVQHQCLSPSQTSAKLSELDNQEYLVDPKDFMSALYQRPYHYLTHRNGQYKHGTNVAGTKDVLDLILRECGSENPTWGEVNSFIRFLNMQLQQAESFFTGQSTNASEIDTAIAATAKFLIQMSKDFSSFLDTSEESLQNIEKNGLLNWKRNWNSSPHGYIMFNHDQRSMEFIGFKINSEGNIYIENTESEADDLKTLASALQPFGIVMKDHILPESSMSREGYLGILRKVVGVTTKDPDPTYELTEDNVKKILAVHMRFKCGIPVIIMGETGCGKTRLVQFLCDLMKQDPTVQNRVIMKVHGGTTDEDIYQVVQETNSLSQKNNDGKVPGKEVVTVLFFDEANTTESIGLIKELMCDRIKNKRLTLQDNVAIVAACNPYRKHTDAMIKRLETAGLGFRKRAEESNDFLGQIPKRHLVYRVESLPMSLCPFVWDIGTLTDDVEFLYIKQIVHRKADYFGIPEDVLKVFQDTKVTESITNILSQSQVFMRSLPNECRYVSLRDVERTLHVFCWFCNKYKFMVSFLNLAQEKKNAFDTPVECLKTSLMLSLGICYHASLESDTRAKFRDHVTKYFTGSIEIKGDGPDAFLKELDKFQSLFLEHMPLRGNIARNHALKENVFLMAVCTQINIPLYVVGKPGSSKTLAKEIVRDALKGRGSKSKFCRGLKQVHMVNYQCSQKTTAESVLAIFDKVKKLQDDRKDMAEQYVAVPTFEEAGLAEDSDKMPLKVLHPLFDDAGSQSNKKAMLYCKFPFIGISNWALDPAKMNRGILVQRDNPGSEELIKTAKGICSSSVSPMDHLIPLFAAAYTEICAAARKALNDRREFFGLRDFYNVIKCLNSDHEPTNGEIKYAFQRNFEGIKTVDPWAIVRLLIHCDNAVIEGPDCSATGLIHANLQESSYITRHLLLITENYAALAVIPTLLMKKPVIIFKSAFALDQTESEFCNNLKKIKECMEAGDVVILWNLETHSSLYDALNGSYSYLGKERYVEIGLGAERVKCHVHKDFRLILIANKKEVEETYETPLVNRLEKHILTIDTVLTEEQRKIVTELNAWVNKFVNHSSLKSDDSRFDASDVFVGFSANTVPAIVYNLSSDITDNRKKLYKGTCELLQGCAPDAIMRLQPNAFPEQEMKSIYATYFSGQWHETFADYLQHVVCKDRKTPHFLAEITTHSPLLNKRDVEDIVGKQEITFNQSQVFSAGMHLFGTMDDFRRRIRSRILAEEEQLLIFQFSSGKKAQELLACAKHCVNEELRELEEKATKRINIIFIIHLPKGIRRKFKRTVDLRWISYHIDELPMSRLMIPPLKKIVNLSVADLFLESLDERIQDKEKLDVGVLIKMALHGAANLLKDREGAQERKLDRLQKLKLLLDDTPLLRVIWERMTQLMEEKESSTESSKLRDWIKSNVVDMSAINRAGTYRKSMTLHLEEVVKPVLAGLIAFLDTNNNINALQNDGGAVVGDVWLDMFRDENITEIQHRDLYLVDQKYFDEFPVSAIGNKELSFSTQFPFSWIIKDYIDGYMAKNCQNMDNDERISEFHRKFGSIFDEHIDLEEGSNRTLFYQKYAHDVVYMYFWEKNCPEKALELIIAALCGANMEVDCSPVEIHALLKTWSSRLDIFLRSLEMYPDLVNKMEQFEKEYEAVYFEKSNFPSVHSMKLDLKVMALILQQLMKKVSWDNEKARILWFEEVEKSEVIIEYSLSIWNSEVNIEPEFSQWIAIFKNSWNKVCSMKMILYEVKDIDARIQQKIKAKPQNYKVLWMIFERNKDFGDVSTLENFAKYIKSCSDNREKEFKKQAAPKCASKSCKKILIQFRDLPCECLICDKCYTEGTKRGNQCPNCKQPYPIGEIVPLKQAASGTSDPLLLEYRRKMLNIFNEVVHSMCLGYGFQERDDVCKWLLEHAMGTKCLLRSGNAEAEDMETSSIGLLQELIKQKEDFVKEYIKDLLKTEKDEMLLDKVVFQYVLCQEQLAQSRPIPTDSDCDRRFEAAISCLRSTERLVRLDAIVETKMLLHHLTDKIHKSYRLKNNKQEQRLAKILETLSSLEKEFIIWPRIFLFRLLVQRFGLQTYDGILKHNKLDEHTLQNVRTGLDYYKIYNMEIYCSLVNQLLSGEKIPEMKSSEETMVQLGLAVQTSVIAVISDASGNIKQLAKRIESLSESFYKEHDLEIVRKLANNKVANRFSRMNYSCQSTWEETEMIKLLINFNLVIKFYRSKLGLFNSILDFKALCLPTLSDADKEVFTGRWSHLLEKTQTCPEVRGMIPVTMATIKHLLLMTFVLGGNDDPEGLMKVLGMEMSVEELEDLMWKTSQDNLHILASTQGWTPEECILWLHLVIKQLSKAKTIDVDYATVEGRNQWEKEFQTNVILPLINNDTDRLFKDSFKLICSDMGDSVRLYLELDDISELGTAQMEFCPIFWRYQQPVTLEHVSRMLYLQQLDTTIKPEENKKLANLQLLLNEADLLRAVVYLPSLVKLRYFVMSKYDRNISRSAARKLKISDVIANKTQGQEQNILETLISELENLLAILRRHHDKLTFNGSPVLPEMLAKIADNTPIERILPSEDGSGQCIPILIQILGQIQNNFVQKCACGTEKRPEEVAVDTVHSSQLVTVDPELDLMPLVLSHATYKLHGTAGCRTATYDFLSLANIIHEKFVRNKPVLNKCEINEGALLTYTDDITHTDTFTRLKRKVSQVNLSYDEQRKLEKEQQRLSFPTLCDHRDKTEILIGYLISIGKKNDKDTKLVTYLEEKLKLERDQAMARWCTLGHVENYWLILSHEIAKQQLRQQDPFRGTIKDLKSEIKDPLVQERLRKIVKQFHHKVDPFLLYLFKGITFVLQDLKNDDYEKPLKEVLPRVLPVIKAEESSILTDPMFDPSILVKHTIHTWKITMEVKYESTDSS